MIQTKVDSKVLSILEDKIQLIKTGKGAIYLVGPIRLPVNLYGETVLFQWYCWLNCEEVTEDFEKVIQKLSSSNLFHFLLNVLSKYIPSV